MPRPRKCRRIGYVPNNLIFQPQEPNTTEVILLVEEMEAIRLSDLEQMDQSKAADAMGVSRGTFQRIIGAAREKVAKALIHGYSIRLMEAPQCEWAHQQGMHGCGICCRGKRKQSRGENTMKIAVASEGKQVSAHFGHCEGFNIFEIVDGKVVGSMYALNPGHCKAAPAFLNEQGVEVVLGGGMGAGARNNLTAVGIKVVTGVSGAAEEAVLKFLDGTLETVGGECTGHGHEGGCGGHGHHPHEGHGNCGNH